MCNSFPANNKFIITPIKCVSFELIDSTIDIIRDLRKMRSRFRVHYRIFFTNFCIFCIFCIFSHFMHISVENWKKSFFLIFYYNSAKFHKK